jgi:glycosyltransferase involved in cell wall biosynthesis
VTSTPFEPPKRGRRARVLVVEQPGEGLWGAQQYLLRLAPLLEARGYDQVLAAPEGSAVARAWRQQGRPHVHFPVPPERKIRRHGDRGPLSPLLLARELARTAANARRIAALGSALQVDCIHANAHWSHLEAALGGRLARLPVVLLLHDLLPGIAGRLRAAAVRIADASVAVSNAAAGSLPERARSRVTVIHNGVDPLALSPGPAQPDIRRELATDPSAPIVLAMCRLDPRKGVDQIIRSVAALDGDLGRAQLAILGASSTGEEGLARRLRVLGAELLGPRVRFLGPRQDVAAVLRSVDVLVQASSREALGLSVLEAQACGTPVVAYPAYGTSEIVRDGETGLLARQDDVAHLSACIGRALTDAGLRAHLARAARAQVVTTFTLEQQADRQARLLNELVAGGRGDRRLRTRSAIQQEFTA